MKWEYKQLRNYKILKPLTNNIYDFLIKQDKDAQVSFLKDTRKIHRALFYNLTPLGQEELSGIYRGEPNTILEYQHVTIFHKNPAIKEYGAPPFKVRVLMEELANEIETLVYSDLYINKYIEHSFCIFAKFLLIHPYLNGNGHISRILLKVLLNIKGVNMKNSWTLHERPHNFLMIKALKNFNRDNQLLINYLWGWINQ